MYNDILNFILFFFKQSMKVKHELLCCTWTIKRNKNTQNCNRFIKGSWVFKGVSPNEQS